MARDFARELARLDQRVKNIEKGQRYAHGGSIEDSALEVKDGSGSLRAIVGVQSDGTTAVNIVNGPPPPTPSAPILASVLGGVTVSWNGGFADGTVPPLDWQRVEVHASTVDGFTPALETLKNTFETPQGGTVVVPCEEPVYVLLVARSTSGTPSEPTVQAGPLGPAPVVATDILDGIVTTLKLADDAVTTAKIAAGAVDTVALADNAVLAEKLADNAVKVGKIDTNAVTGPAIAANAVTAGKIDADAVTAREIAAGSVTASEIAAGAVTTDKLTVSGGGNLLSDPSFEGAYTEALVAGDAFWSVDASKGNSSAKSLQVNAASASSTNRDLALFSMAALPGDQLYLAVDYQASTDYVGTPRIFARWENATGGFLATGAAQASPPTLGPTWQRISATVTAPANTARFKLMVASTGGSAGRLWFDNAAVRPVAGGTQIADGAVTTQKIVSGAVQTAQLDAGAVNADKIASGAVTTAKLDALAVTADKIAANAITAGKILAGAVDATALAADAITGKTITGGTITGAQIQTATTGQRITINEADANKVLVYNADGTTIGELSDRGLLLAGTTGAIVWMDPSATQPQLRFDNSTSANTAYITMVETTGPNDANLHFISGTFSGDGYTDRVWRQYMGNDFARIERVRFGDGLNHRGGRLNLRADYAEIGYMSYATPSDAGYHLYQPAAVTTKGRHIVDPQDASSNSVLYVAAQSAHSGPLLRLYRDTDKFAVDKDGNTVISGMMTAGNIITGTTTITPSAAHTPTSAPVSFPALKGSTFRGYATAATTVPGVRTPVGAQGVTGVSVSSVTSTGMLVWVNRENTTATIVNWMVIGS